VDVPRCVTSSREGGPHGVFAEHKGAVGKADKNTFVDKVHLISALPYVDKIITSDLFFKAIYPAAQASGHVKAVLVSNEEFMKGV